MKRETIKHATEAAWLADRKRFVTSTEAAALFDAGVYVRTFYELWAIKSGTIQPEDFDGNDRTRWGNRLEAPIAYGVAEDLGLIVEPFKVFITMPDFGVASSFDFIVTGLVDGADENPYREAFRKHGRGLLEIKNVDALQFRRAWLDDGEALEAPVHIEAQVQHQLEVADVEWAIIAPLVGGNTPKPMLRIRDRATGEAIRTKAAELWQRIAANNPPAPDFTKDGATIAQVYLQNDGSSLDLSDNPRLGQLCRTYKAAGEREKAAKADKDAAKAELLTIVKAAKAIQAPGFKISAGTNASSFRAYYRDGYEKISISISEIPGKHIEAEVGAFRNVRITEVK